jgi:hypothetical protein
MFQICCQGVTQQVMIPFCSCYLVHEQIEMKKKDTEAAGRAKQEMG